VKLDFIWHAKVRAQLRNVDRDAHPAGLTRYAETGDGDVKALDILTRRQEWSSLRKQVVRHDVQDSEDIDCGSADRR
jgi:hypothetical protein